MSNETPKPQVGAAWRKFEIHKPYYRESEKEYADRIEQEARLNGWLYGEPTTTTTLPFKKKETP